MSTTQSVLVPILGILAGGWVCLSGLVLLARAVHDLHRPAEPPARAPTTGWYRWLSWLPWRRPSAAYLLAAEAAAPDTPETREAARLEVARNRDGLLRVASSHRGDLDRWRRVAALRVLTRAGDPEAQQLLERALDEGDEELAGAAVDIVGTMGTRDAAELLVRVLREGTYARSRVATHLDGSTIPIADLLLPLLDDPLPTVRFWAATLLAGYGYERGVGVALASHAADSAANVRAAVAESLGSARRSRSRDAAIRQLLADPVWFVRVHAARSAGKLGLTYEARALTEMLADREWWVRSAAKDGLAALGPAAYPALIEALDHPDRFARNGAAEVLHAVGYVDALVESVVEATAPRCEEVARLRRIVEAGGPELRRSVLAGAEREHRERLEQLLSDQDRLAEAA